MTNVAKDAAGDAARVVAGDHLTRYLRSGGADGHFVDNSSAGGHWFGTACLIRYKGRRSGRTLITPLSYAAIGGEVVIVASRGGSDNHPLWYLNLVANEEVDFQIATSAFRATWREPQGAERQKIWNFMVDCYPYYGVYQNRTDRQIPLIIMKPLECIPVFTEADIT